jgi:hypothetical protein
MNGKVVELHEVLENAPEWAKPIAELAEWSLNYDYKTGTPYWEFLDLIGYSEEKQGYKINTKHFQLDYASVDSFADALKVWAVRPHDVYEFCDRVGDAD